MKEKHYDKWARIWIIMIFILLLIHITFDMWQPNTTKNFENSRIIMLHEDILENRRNIGKIALILEEQSGLNDSIIELITWKPTCIDYNSTNDCIEYLLVRK